MARHFLSVALAVTILAAMITLPLALNAQEMGRREPPGLTTPVALPPFDPNRERCAAPPGLQRLLVFAQDNERDFMQGVRQGLSLAAADRDMAFRVALPTMRPLE